MKESILREKSYQFALRVIKLYKYIVAEKNEYILSKQILFTNFRLHKSPSRFFTKGLLGIAKFTNHFN